MSRRGNRVAETQTEADAEVPDAVPPPEPQSEAASAAEVRVQCLTNQVGTSRGRIIFGQRINLPADEAKRLAGDGAVEVVRR